MIRNTIDGVQGWQVACVETIFPNKIESSPYPFIQLVTCGLREKYHLLLSWRCHDVGRSLLIRDVIIFTSLSAGAVHPAQAN